MSSSESSLSPHIRLGLQCRELRRYADAERHFREALSEDPNDDVALRQLAMTVHLQDDREREALEIIDRAIAIDPNDAQHHVGRAFILNSLERPAEALRAARTARELDPWYEGAMAAEAQSHLLLKNWAEAERAAREALAIDPDDATSANLLSQALRLQGKRTENDEQIAGLLERDPENEFTHCNAGWAALHRSDHRAAEGHFREALRLNPEFDPAREGLLTSFRARSPIYRGYLAYCMWMARLKGRAQFAVIVGLLIGQNVLRRIAEKFSPALAVAIGAAYLLFVLWGFVADAVGNFILLFDRFARYALRPLEKVEATVVGGGVVAGIIILLAGIAFQFEFFWIVGGILMLGSIPLSLVFTNRSKVGAAVFASVAACLWLGLFVAFIDDKIGLKLLEFGAIGCILSTWLSSVPFLRRRQ